MIYKLPEEKPRKIKKNEQVSEVHKAATRKTYTEEEVAEIVRLAQLQGGKE